MEFREKQAIYLQIADYFAANILQGKWTVDQKVPSVRQLAVELEVNPNTVMRTYAYLQENEIIYNKRGIGYFVSDKAKQIILKIMKTRFVENELPQLFKTMTLLNISISDLDAYYEKWSKNKSNLKTEES